MIQYSTGQWSISFLFARRGSVFGKALVWAVPAAGAGLFVYWLKFHKNLLPDWETDSGVGAMWSSFTFVLGFLLVFRTQSAYSRYWEGATLVQQARASFFNCSSSLVAFSSMDPTKKKYVDEFQHLLVRLMSMLHCVGLQTVAEMSDVKFEFFNTEGMDHASLKFLSLNTDKHQRCEIVIQWIQRLIVDADKAEILDVPAPILTRVFQELSQGASYIINARIMTGIPFPFPYAQLLTVLLLAHWALTPFFSAVVMKSGMWSAIFSFVSVFAFWGVNYIAAEIEAPFGDDPNDLPLHALQKDMNKSLWILLHPNTQTVPTFKFDPVKHRKWDMICKENFHKVNSETKSILMTGRSKIWAQRMSAVISGSQADLASNLPTYSNKSTGPTEKSSGFLRSKTALSSARTSLQSQFSVHETGEGHGESRMRGDAGEDELPTLQLLGDEDSIGHSNDEAKLSHGVDQLEAKLRQISSHGTDSHSPKQRYGRSASASNLYGRSASASSLYARGNSYGLLSRTASAEDQAKIISLGNNSSEGSHSSKRRLSPTTPVIPEDGSVPLRSFLHRAKAPQRCACCMAVQEFLENYVSRTVQELIRLQETMRADSMQDKPFLPAVDVCCIRM